MFKSVATLLIVVKAIWYDKIFDVFKLASSGKIGKGGVTAFAPDSNGELFVSQVGNVYRISAMSLEPLPHYLPVIYKAGDSGFSNPE
jgi:hypothetical protein